ncbi:hypothetical protein ANN_02972 [Periplaneta americana]|uniref:Uncharacterized protein n=1 Tax=Periplaneta americana TaxID=6978 RepID=A0ABQ8TYX2_PERAM|nr:hypothetical protein ANN_02972 [Periplaneta americana]
MSLQDIESSSLEEYMQHLQNLTVEFNDRFVGVQKLEQLFCAFDTPFSCDVNGIKDASIQMELKGVKGIYEQGFSIMKRLKTHHRNRLSDYNLLSSFRICLSNSINPNIQSLVDAKNV